MRMSEKEQVEDEFLDSLKGAAPLHGGFITQSRGNAPIPGPSHTPRRARSG